VAAVNAAERPAESAKKSPPIVKIQNAKSRKCITVEKVKEGAYVVQMDCNKPGVANRWFKDVSTEAPYFTLSVIYQDRNWCIGVDGGSPLPNKELRLFHCDDRANQRWKVYRGGIKNYDQLCIGVDNAGVEDRVRLKQFPCKDDSNQNWALLR
jgi:hypothetical protein